jgi:hypothetical protein
MFRKYVLSPDWKNMSTKIIYLKYDSKFDNTIFKKITSVEEDPVQG